MDKPVYKRIILKISGESLSGADGRGFDADAVNKTAEMILDAKSIGVDICVVVGGGNIWRGRIGKGMDRPTADSMGMLATAINALCLSDAIIRMGGDAKVLSAINLSQVAEFYNSSNAKAYLEEGRILIFACGIGNPFFSTDTTASMRAAELGADIVFKATKVNGVYTDDPFKNPDAKKIDEISYLDILNKGLSIMDATAISLCMDNNIKILVFKMEGDNIKNAIYGQKIGTIIS